MSALLATDFISVDDLNIRYTCRGSGEDVVLLHGFPETLQGWYQVLPALAERCRVHAFDWPGLGQSTRPEPWGCTPREYARFLGRLLDHLNIPHASLVAVDVAVPPALLYTLENPQRIRRLVVSDGPVFFRPELLSWEDRAILVGGVGELMVAFPRTMVRYVFHRGFVGWPTLPPEVYGDCKAQAECPVFRRNILPLFRNSRDDLEYLEQNLADLEVPLLAIWGENDAFVQSRMGEELHRTVTRSQLEIVEQAGHYVHHERPAEFLRLVSNFLGIL